MATLETAVLFTRAFLIGFKITKPLSQNTGIDTTHPISSIASSGCFLPTILITISASLSAAPVFSRTEPIKAPKIITIPILLNVPENPCPITVGIPATVFPSTVLSTNGIPARIARIRDTPMIAKKG